MVLAFSHAQADAISTTIEPEHCTTRALCVCNRFANMNMAPGAKQETLLRTWGNKVLVVNEEISMMPAEAINMDMYRAMWGRHEQFSVDPD